MTKGKWRAREGEAKGKEKVSDEKKISVRKWGQIEGT